MMKVMKNAISKGILSKYLKCDKMARTGAMIGSVTTKQNSEKRDSRPAGNHDKIALKNIIVRRKETKARKRLNTKAKTVGNDSTSYLKNRTVPFAKAQ
jgi:hypothetical protein